jgi:hypothetical protein
MGRAIKIGAALLLLTLFLISSMHVSVYGQQQPSGVVTAVQGQAELTRGGAPKPTLLRQKDGVMIRDVIDTREKSMARMLFGGKATITLKELSRFEVREETLAGGATRSTVDLSSGALLVNVARELMKPGDEIIIRTNNAVATVRGSMIYAETHEPGQSAFAQISGEAVLSCPTSATSATVSLTRFTATDVKGSATDCNLGAIRTITEEFAAILLRSFQLPRAITGAGNSSQIFQNGLADAGAISQAALVTGGGPIPGTCCPPPSPPPPPPHNASSIKLPPPCRTC